MTGEGIGRGIAEYIMENKAEEMLQRLETAFQNGCPEQINAFLELPENAISRLVAQVADARVHIDTGAETAYYTGNMFLAGCGGGIAGYSALRYPYATDKRAKACYAASTVCGLVGLGSGATAAAAAACHLSKPAIAADLFGVVFLTIGDEAQRLAEKFEGRPSRGRRPMTYGGWGRSDPAFILPSSSQFISTIPFETIGRAVGYGLTIYTYSRISITVYRYGKQLIIRYIRYRNKKQVQSKNKKFKKAMKLLISLTYMKSRTNRINRVYQFAVVCG